MKSQPIPVKIVETSDQFNNKKLAFRVDIRYYFKNNSNTDVTKTIKKFEKLYLKQIIKSKKNFPINKRDRKAIHFWKVGKLLSDFQVLIKNDFKITNYNDAISRDFGLYCTTVVSTILQFVKYFSKEDVNNNILFTHYQEFIFKANELYKIGQLKQEKTRLLKMAVLNERPNHKVYRKELVDIIRKRKSLK